MILKNLNILLLESIHNIAFNSLPEDMQQLVIDILSSSDKNDYPDDNRKLNLVSLSLSSLPDIETDTDYRSAEKYREEFESGESFPPILIYGKHILDGRHRIKAYRLAGSKNILAIDLKAEGWKIPLEEIKKYSIGKIRYDINAMSNDEDFPLECGWITKGGDLFLYNDHYSGIIELLPEFEEHYEAATKFYTDDSDIMEYMTDRAYEYGLRAIFIEGDIVWLRYKWENLRLHQQRALMKLAKAQNLEIKEG